MSRIVTFFFFKQKTAYEIASCLVGSEMCIRDRPKTDLVCEIPIPRDVGPARPASFPSHWSSARPGPVSYTHLTLPTIYSV